jgi:hypothetical protein
MAAFDERMFPDDVEDFAEDWYRFRGMLGEEETEAWDVLVERVENRPYPGHCHIEATHDDPKWPIVMTMLVTQQAEIGRLREQVHDLEERLAVESADAPDD